MQLIACVTMVLDAEANSQWIQGAELTPSPFCPANPPPAAPSVASEGRVGHEEQDDGSGQDPNELLHYELRRGLVREA